MGLEAVKDEILMQAKERESSMLADARKEAGRLMAEAQKKADDLRQKSDEEVKKLIETSKKQALAAGDLEIKKMVLEAKKQIMDASFAEALKKIEGMDDKKRESYLKKLLERIEKDIKVGRTYTSKRDIKLLKAAKCEPADITGGIIAEDVESKVRVDFSFDTILQGIKEMEIQEINKILFG